MNNQLWATSDEYSVMSNQLWVTKDEQLDGGQSVTRNMWQEICDEQLVTSNW